MSFVGFLMVILWWCCTWLCRGFDVYGDMVMVVYFHTGTC